MEQGHFEATMELFHFSPILYLQKKILTYRSIHGYARVLIQNQLHTSVVEWVGRTKIYRYGRSARLWL